MSTRRGVAESEKVTRSFVNRLLRLTLLAPDIQEAVLGGRQPKTEARGTDETRAHRLARAALGPLVRQYSTDETSDGGTSPARLRRHQVGEASLEAARTFLTRLRLAFFSSTIFRPRPICLANSDRRAA